VDDTRWQRAQSARERVQGIAREIAKDASARQNKYAVRAGVRWTLIHELRAAITELDSVLGEDETS